MFLSPDTVDFYLAVGTPAMKMFYNFDNNKDVTW